MSKWDEASDLQELSVSAAGGDENAFRALVARVAPTVYRIAYRMLGRDAEAQDVVQETFIRVWQQLGKVRDHAAIKAWICRIARNLCADRLRAEKRRPADALDEAELSDLAAAIERAGRAPKTPEEQVVSAEERAALLALVATLREKHRMVLLLRMVEGMRCEEIAATLGCPVGTVESRLHRARGELAGKLERAARRRSMETS